MGNFQEALVLMGVGMLTVFLVLLSVILVGNVLIWIVNKFVPEEQTVANATSVAAVTPQVSEAIAKAVAQLTAGKGKVEKIEKI